MLLEEDLDRRRCVGIGNVGVRRHEGRGVEDERVIVLVDGPVRSIMGRFRANESAFVDTADAGFAAATDFDAAVGRRSRLVDETVLIECDGVGRSTGGRTVGGGELRAISAGDEIVYGRLLPFAMGGEVESLGEEGLEHKALLLLCGPRGDGGGEVEERARIGEVGELIEAEVVRFADQDAQCAVDTPEEGGVGGAGSSVEAETTDRALAGTMRSYGGYFEAGARLAETAVCEDGDNRERCQVHLQYHSCFDAEWSGKVPLARSSHTFFAIAGIFFGISARTPALERRLPSCRLSQSVRIEIGGISGEVKSAVLLSLVSLASAIAQPGQQTVAGVIHGTVVRNDGIPAGGIGLTAFTGPLGGRLPFTRTDQSGNYQFERLSWASYAVYVDDEDAGYSIFSTGLTGQANPPEVTLSPEHPEARVDLRLPPPAGFLQIHLTNRKTGTVIPGLEVTLMSMDHPDRPIFMSSSYSNRPILITPDKDLLLHVTSQGFHEWGDSAGAGKRIRLASGSHLGLEVQLEPLE